MEEKKIYYKVIEIMPMESGTSQTTGKEWKSREFVAEEIKDVRYPNQLLMRLSGDDVKLIDGVDVGDTVDLHLSLIGSLNSPNDMFQTNNNLFHTSLFIF